MNKHMNWGDNSKCPNDQERISTGMAYLDELFQGGFLPKKTYLVSGKPGTGKSIFALQFLVANLAENKNSIYVSLNDKPEDIVFAARSLGWDIEPAISQGKLQILDMSPFFSKFAFKSEIRSGQKRAEVNIRKIMVELTEYKKRNSAECLVIDSINSILSDRKDVSESILARELIRSLEAHADCTSILTFDHWDGPGEWYIHPIESYVSGVIDLKLSMKAEEFNRTLSIKKLRATAAEPTTYRFAIKTVEGISVLRDEDDNGDLSSDNGQKKKVIDEQKKPGGFREAIFKRD